MTRSKRNIWFIIDTRFFENKALSNHFPSALTAYENYLEKYALADSEKLKKFESLRGSKKIERTTPDGHTWTYSEGGMSPYDALDLPARTMLTSEGTVNRSTHLLKTATGYRLLTPIEAELLQDFPPDWTAKKLSADGSEADVTDKMRYFFMGNSLVTGIVARIGEELGKLTADKSMNYDFRPAEPLMIAEQDVEYK